MPTAWGQEIFGDDASTGPSITFDEDAAVSHFTMAADIGQFENEFVVGNPTASKATVNMQIPAWRASERLV